MKKTLSLIILTLCFVKGAHAADGDTVQLNKAGLFHKSLWAYASKVFPESPYDGKYTVFVVKLYHLDNKPSLCA